MAMVTDKSEKSSVDINEKIKTLESRISRIEAELHMGYDLHDDPKPQIYSKETSQSLILESRIGEFGLAWLGNIVLFFGIIFLVQFVQKSGYLLGSAILGYILVACIFILAHYVKAIFPKKIYIFNLNAWLLLFYVSLKLHFFTAEPLIANKPIALLLLSIVTATQLFISVKNHSRLMACIVLVLLSIIAIVSDTTHIMLPVSVLIAVVAVLLFYRFGWIRLLYVSVILVYLINLIWFINNPFMGHQIQALSIHQFGYLYIFIIAAIYSLVALIEKSDTSKSGIVGIIVMNGAGFSMILSLIVLSFFRNDYILMIGSVSVFCLLFSILLHIKSDWKIVAALYALFGFITLSIAAYGIYDFPNTYFLLAFQSLLVVSMAIWFRSKFIVIMNTLLFLMLLIFYLTTSLPSDGVNFSFSVVALLTARILNWKKDRLIIKTDLLRNTYLITGFLMVLFTLYHLIPTSFITLSWTAVAVVYFALSLVLKNVKYRYLALATMLAAAFYFFIIDLAKIELVFRILALMFLAIISIGFSIYYTKKSKRKIEKS